MSGYSSTKLIDKLGIKKDFYLAVINPPENYTDILGTLPDGVVIKKSLGTNLDFVHFFAHDKKQLQKIFPQLLKSIKQNGMIWVSWPKKSSKIETDIDENIVRYLGLNIGLVDIKVCAVTEIWSGLKFVIPVKARI